MLLRLCLGALAAAGAADIESMVLYSLSIIRSDGLYSSVFAKTAVYSVTARGARLLLSAKCGHGRGHLSCTSSSEGGSAICHIIDSDVADSVTDPYNGFTDALSATSESII